jgi:signal transduction histidine kinase/ActR/RegA family two-component response regulator
MNNHFKPLQIVKGFTFTIRAKLFIILALLIGFISVSIYKYFPIGIEKKATITWVSLSIFLLGTLFVFFISLVITRPLTKLVSTIKQVPGDDLSRRVPFLSTDEVGTLATSFNLILANLETKASELQKKIKEQKSVREALKQAEAEKRILQEQLRQLQKMGTIGKQAEGIVHDFNNIMTVIIGYTDLTLDLVPEGSVEERNLKRVMAASNRAKEMAKQILTFSRNGDNDRKPLWLNEEVGEALKLMRSTMPANIKLRENIVRTSNPVMADKYELQQIIVNLCSNANHAMREKGGVLTVSLGEVRLEPDAIDGIYLRPGYYHHLTISDTGHGIDPGILHRIFDPYFTTKRKDEGIGIGLDMVHRIIKNDKGDITVYSEPGKGTTFHIFLPGVRQEKKKHNTDIELSMSKNGAGERILFVDDDPALAAMGERLLEKLGYRVEVSTQSHEAFEAFYQAPHRFDIVVSDYIMPNMTGLQLAGKIKEIRADIPIIMCTGFSESVNKNNFKSLGIDGFFMKPIVIKQLARLVRKLLDEKRANVNYKITSF